MGIDVELHAVGTITDDELERANEYMLERGVHEWGQDEPPLSRTEWGARWNTLNRYYGDGYERGPWPEIHNAIVCLRAALPHCEIRYGGDVDIADPPGCPVTDELLSGIWDHWLSEDGVAYRRRQRRDLFRRVTPTRDERGMSDAPDR